MASCAQTVGSHRQQRGGGLCPAKMIAVSTVISDALPFGKLWYGELNAVSNAVDYAKFRGRLHDAVIRVLQ
jgi:hypothetical protein